MLIKKETSLENINNDTKETLSWKMEKLTNDNLPVEQGLADYIYFGMSNIDAKIKQLKAYKDQIIKEVKSLEAYKNQVQEEVAEWIEGQGIDKLNGIECSSITITKGKEETEEKLTKSKIVYDFSSQEYEDVNDFLVKNGFAHYEHIEETNINVATKDKIRINKKRQ